MTLPALTIANMTEIDFGQISAYQRYRQMPSLIVPRPIALVTRVPTGW